jgi:2-polyprenyl-6-methoxyphenol hydroxylase-like FAD-dependent oxidoreductase
MPALQVVIVGAGIAGLTLAGWLARRGIRCTVFEQSGAPGTFGAGIQLTPNGTRLLGRLGLGDALDAVALRPAAIEFRRGSDDEPIGRTVLGRACVTAYGAPHYTLLRADLHRTLLRGVPDGVVRRGRKCVGVEERADGAVVSFADGSRVTADLVVGADGIHSVVRRRVGLPDPGYSGHVAYRMLVDAGRMPLPGPEPRAEPDVVIWLGPGRHAVRYPVAGGRQLNVVATAPVDRWGAPSWRIPGRTEDVLRGYDGWHPRVRATLAAAHRVTCWALHHGPVPTRLATRRLAVVGDAAYPILPFGAQGANQAIEDAVALGVCLEEAGCLAEPGAVPAALRRYERVRLPRRIQVGDAVRANTSSHHLTDVTAQRQRDRQIRASQQPRDRDWLYGYDAELAGRDPASARTTVSA